MIRVEVRLTGGCLSRLSVSGHDRSKGGEESFPCGIVSALARTAARLLEREKEISWSGDAPAPGDFWLEITDVPVIAKDWLRGISDFLLTGLQDIERDYPETVRLQVKRK